MLYFETGGPGTSLSDGDIRTGLYTALDSIGKGRPVRRVLAVPPDITRFHSRAGLLTVYIRDYYGEALTDILPALGTHNPMTAEELDVMFPGVDHGLFRSHSWRSDLHTLGHVPASFLKEVSEGTVNCDWPAQVNNLVSRGKHDLILSVGQVVPHEVIGFANHNKNIFIGTGGDEGIHRSHYLGAVFGMERIMGRIDTPVRRVLNYAGEHFASHLPIVYVLTVVSPDAQGRLHARGLFIGDGYDCYLKAAALSLRVNVTPVPSPVHRAVVCLDPREYRSTWLGNKAIYRTRMAMADKGELYIIAPGVGRFGEDPIIDSLIRRHGYRGTGETLKALKESPELQANLCAVAHLIHGSSEGRFSVIYAPGRLSREEIESTGYEYMDITAAKARFDTEGREDGFHRDIDGEEYFLVNNPALGLWTHPDNPQ